jgi:hypothetical protein
VINVEKPRPVERTQSSKLDREPSLSERGIQRLPCPPSGRTLTHHDLDHQMLCGIKRVLPRLVLRIAGGDTLEERIVHLVGQKGQGIPQLCPRVGCFFLVWALPLATQ